MERDEPRLRKFLTRNDIGTTGSHQAGIHVPKAVLGHFPRLDSSRLNPDCWISVESDHGSFRWRFIYYNNRKAGGTRDEYRLTHIREFLLRAGAKAGDILEVVRMGSDAYRCRVINANGGGDALVLSTSGPWRVVAIRRS
jgi:hypothetical protein